MLRQSAGQGDRGHGTRERKGREHHQLTSTRRGNDASAHQKIEHQGRIGIRHRVADRGVQKLLLREAVGDAEHFIGVCNGLCSTEENEGHFLGHGEDRLRHGEMADVRRNVLRFNKWADHVDDVEGLRDAAEVIERFERAGITALFDIGEIGRAASRADADIVASDHHLTACATAKERDLRGCLPDDFHERVGIKANDLSVLFGHASRDVERARLIIENLDADIPQHLERGLMDRLDLVGAELLDRGVGPNPLAPRLIELLHRCTGAFGCASPTLWSVHNWSSPRTRAR